MNTDTPRSFMFLSYEDMHNNPRKQLERVLGFIGEKNFDENILNESIQYASFENMRRLEQQGKFGDSILRPRNRDDEYSYKVRLGRIGAHREEFKVDDMAFIDDVIASFDFGVFEKYRQTP